MAEPWFDPEGFFLAERIGDDGRRLVGFHWTKVHGGSGPAHDRRTSRTRTTASRASTATTRSARSTSSASTPPSEGTGLGRALTLVGLRHLRHRGLPDAMLYVDADNAAAIALYTRPRLHPLGDRRHVPA